MVIGDVLDIFDSLYLKSASFGEISNLTSGVSFR